MKQSNTAVLQCNTIYCDILWTVWSPQAISIFHATVVIKCSTMEASPISYSTHFLLILASFPLPGFIGFLLNKTVGCVIASSRPWDHTTMLYSCSCLGTVWGVNLMTGDRAIGFIKSWEREKGRPLIGRVMLSWLLCLIYSAMRTVLPPLYI